MPDENNERPLAHPEFEKTAGELFPYASQPPEEYAGRKGGNWSMFSFDNYRYRDVVLDAWIQRLGTILFTPDLLDHYQNQYLTPEEIAEQKKQAEEDWT